MKTAPFYLMQKNLNTDTGLFQNLVLCGDWDFEANGAAKTINTTVRFSKNVEFLDFLKFQDEKTAREYCDRVNAYGYKMQVASESSEWELRINEFKK